MPVKNDIQTLLQEVVAGGLPLDQLRGVAFYDAAKDARLTSLKSVGAAEQAITMVPHFTARLGAENAKRVVLQFIYQYFARVDSVRYDAALFETLWEEPQHTPSLAQRVSPFAAREGAPQSHICYLCALLTTCVVEKSPQTLAVSECH
jgi:hypothetical protein